LICVFRGGGFWIFCGVDRLRGGSAERLRLHQEVLMFIASVICVLIAAAIPFALALLGLRRRS
jgi:hypothetical protein